MNPNSQNQTWSRWVFTIFDGGHLVPYKDVEYNVAKWLRQGFGSVGRVRIAHTTRGWRIEAVVEGAPVKDPAYVDAVRSRFQDTFVNQGFGPIASSRVEASLMSGNPDNGRAREQWVEIPTVMGSSM